MARCKECYHYEICAKQCRMVQIDEHTWDNYEELDDVEKFCEQYIPTADVAPKSEVEKQKLEIWRLEGEIERLKRICNSYALQYGTVRDQQKVIDEAKAEVAREIFEEIESKLIVAIAPVSFDGMARIWVDDFCELKKKYTEGEYMQHPIHPCIGCIYFKACGENTRTMPCEGRMTKSEKKKLAKNGGNR